jgi:DNA-binding MarR family transcriptional regulator
VTELAERSGVTKQTAGALVDDLERHPYVTRTPDPADARARLVVLTARGLRLCAAAAADLAAIELQWREHLGHGDYEQMRRALQSLREITDPYR